MRTYIFVRLLHAHLLKKIDESEETLDKKKDKWQKKISQLEIALEKTKDSPMKRRPDVITS
jgi:hypothetical protein